MPALLTRQLLRQLRHFLAELFLLALQALQLAAALLFRHVLHAPGQITLCAGQTFLTARQLFQLVLFLGGLSAPATARALRRLVAVLQLPHLHLEQLAQVFTLLLRPAAAPAATGLLGADVGAVDVGLSFQNVLQCHLLGLQGTGDLLLLQLGDRQVHLFDSLLQIQNGIVITVVGEIQSLRQTLDGLLRARGGLGLGLGDDADIGSQCSGVRVQWLIAQLPGRSNDVFLQRHQCTAFAAALPATSATAALLPAGTTEFLIGGHHLQEVDVGHDLGRPGQAIVVGQREVIADEVARRHAEVFQVDHFGAGDAAGLLFGQEVHSHLVGADDVVMQVETAESVVVTGVDFQHHFLQGHHVLIAARALEHQLGRLVGNCANEVIQRVEALQVFEVAGDNVIDAILGHGEAGLAGAAVDAQRDALVARAFLEFDTRRLDVLVEDNLQFHLCALGHQHVAGIRLGVVLNAGVLGIGIGHIDLLHTRQVIDRDAELFGALLAVLFEIDVVDQILLHGGQEVTVAGAVTAAGVLEHCQVLPVHVVALDAQLNLAGHGVGHARHDGGRLAALHGDVARFQRDLDRTGLFDHEGRRFRFRAERPEQTTGRREHDFREHEGHDSHAQGGGGTAKGHPGHFRLGHAVNPRLLLLHVQFSIGPQLADELLRDATAAGGLLVRGEFKGSQEALFEVGDAVFHEMGKGLIIALQTAKSAGGKPDGPADTREQQHEQQNGDGTSRIQQRFDTTEQQRPGRDGNDCQTDMMQGVKPVAAATDIAEGLAQVFECGRCHVGSSCLCKNVIVATVTSPCRISGNAPVMPAPNMPGWPNYPTNRAAKASNGEPEGETELPRPVFPLRSDICDQRLQPMLEDFARRRGRQRHEDDPRRPFVGRQIRLDERLQRRGVQCAARHRLHAGHHQLVALGALADHCTEYDVRMPRDHRLDFGRIHIESGMNDQLLAAPGNMHVASLIQAHQIARVQEALRIDHCRRGLGVAVIAAHDAWSAHMQFPHLARGHFAPLRVAQPYLQPRQRPAHAAIVQTFVPAHLADGGAALGHAIGVEQADAEQGFGILLDGGVERRTAGIEEAHAGHVRRADALRTRVFQKPGIHGGHAQQAGDVLLTQRAQHHGWFETVSQHQCRATVQRRKEHGGQTEDVRQGQHAVNAILRRHAAQDAGDGGDVENVAVSQHDALRVARGACGVDHHADARLYGELELGQGRCGGIGHKHPQSGAIKQQFGRRQLTPQRLPVRIGGGGVEQTHGEPWLAMLLDAVDLRARQPGIDYHTDGVQFAQGQNGDEQRHTVLIDQQHAIARANALFTIERLRSVHPLFQLRETAGLAQMVAGRQCVRTLQRPLLQRRTDALRQALQQLAH